MRSVRKGNPNTDSREIRDSFKLSIYMYTTMVNPNSYVYKVTNVKFIVTSGAIKHLLRSIFSKQGKLCLINACTRLLRKHSIVQ